jgi:radical SAM family protein/4Fe-4S single cluster protein
VAHACNLTCEGCAHFSNSGHKGMITLEEAAATMEAWKRRLMPSQFTLLGGEPTLNPRLAEFIYLARKCWPNSQIVLTTNGFFLDRHPDLPKALHETGARVDWSIHHDGPEYLAKAQQIKSIWDSWLREYPFKIRIEDSARRWTRRHRGVGPDVLPFDDRDLRSSWKKCAARTCRQLFRGKLWKCSSITYLQLQKEKYPDLSPAWDPYLAYEAISPDCTDEQLDAFLAREEEPICGMCPARPEPFTKPSPLIPLGTILKNRNAASRPDTEKLVGAHA